ncbi:MAG: hypothetical protein HC902_10165 [Calothrix sp. SM1_5_4]|nr:hypothetical protein [Calothrix sp. SM1_5_4]
MPHEFYKILHILGLLMIFSGLAGLWGLHVMKQPVAKIHRIGLALIHGLGMMIILVSGFGMLAKLGLFADLPTWFYLKMVVWLALGGSMVLAKRKAGLGVPLLMAWVALGTLAAYLAIYKPG